MRKDIINLFVTIVAFTIIPAIHAQDMGNDSTYYNPDSNYSNNVYSNPDYHYNNPNYYGHMTGGYRDSNGSIRFGRSFDNSDHFTSGISSYQGTSTGPGPNGGYPGTPRGTYPTNYVDTSIYPNSYMRN